ncbi:hypothetical protein DITRI_Ditri13aG0033600 [Diplodiscus trichospermus]
MADAMKPQRSLQESSVLDTQKTEIGVEIEDSFPARPVSPERPDLWSEQQWKSTLSEDELKQRCARCKEMGHSCQHCPYPILHVPDLGRGPDRVKPVVLTPAEGKYRCGRCGRRGHNRRTCHGPVFY